MKDFGSKVLNQNANTGKIVPTNAGGTGGPQYGDNNQILTNKIDNGLSNFKNMDFNLKIDVIHKMMDSSGAVKPMNQIDNYTLGLKDNAVLTPLVFKINE